MPVCKVARLFNPEDFDPSKLTVKFEGNAKDIKAKSVGDILPRKYTLTHSDVTGDLLLSIGPSLNQQQVSAIMKSNAFGVALSGLRWTSKTSYIVFCFKNRSVSCKMRIYFTCCEISVTTFPLFSKAISFFICRTLQRCGEVCASAILMLMNLVQLADWYTRLMRDEIVAEWRGSEQISLHVHCHVSGGHVLLAPAALRNSIFEREMPLVSFQSGSCGNGIAGVGVNFCGHAYDVLVVSVFSFFLLRCDTVFASAVSES